MKDIGVDPLQIVAALVVVTVAGGGSKVGGVHPVFLHGVKDLGLVVLRHLIDTLKALFQTRQNLLTKFIHSRADAKLSVHCI